MECGARDARSNALVGKKKEAGTWLQCPDLDPPSMRPPSTAVRAQGPSILKKQIRWTLSRPSAPRFGDQALVTANRHHRFARAPEAWSTGELRTGAGR